MERDEKNKYGQSSGNGQGQSEEDSSDWEKSSSESEREKRTAKPGIHPDNPERNHGKKR